jgi:DNA-binding CsgD family transcriptional regulator
MKASLQSNVVSLEIGASGVSGNASHFIYPSWNKMPNYALEYVVERDRASSFRKEQSGAVDLQFAPPPVAAASEPAATAMAPGAISAGQRIDAILTPRQRDVFELIVQGMSNKEIARNLQLAEGTVKIHIKALFAKLGVRRRAAVAVAGTRLLSSSERGSC